jgi:hypothetical protein
LISKVPDLQIRAQAALARLEAIAKSVTKNRSIN